MERRTRLGDVIDDYCTRCGLIMNHGVVGMVGDEVRKVRCNTCLSEHVYKRARLPKRKRDQTAKLFDEVLRGLGRKDDAEPGSGDAPADEATAEPTALAGKTAPDATQPGPEVPAAAAPDVPAPDAPAPDDRERGVEAHRRKLFTIRRHSGGRPPGTGTPHR